MSERRPEDVAWAAGIFEGEGCFALIQGGARNGSRRKYLRIVIQMTDGDVIERFAAIAQCGTVNRRTERDPRWKPAFVWSVGGAAALEWSDALRPWLAQRRTERLDELLTEIRDSIPDHPPRVCRYCGGSFAVAERSPALHAFCSRRCQSRAEKLRIRPVRPTPGQLSL